MDQGAAHNLEQPQVHRILRHRAQLKWIYFLSLAMGFASLVMAAVSNDDLSVRLGYSLFGMLAVYFARAWVASSAFSKILISNSGLTICRGGSEDEIRFHQVLSVECPYWGGWITLRIRGGRTLRFTWLLERPEYILDTLAIAQPTLIASKKLAAYRRAAIVADHVFARSEKAFSDWRAIFLMQVLVPTVVAAGVGALLGARQPGDFVLVFASLGLLNACVGIGVWATVEIWQARQKYVALLDNPLNPLRDMVTEAKITRYSRVAHSVIFVACSAWMWF